MFLARYYHHPCCTLPSYYCALLLVSNSSCGVIQQGKRVEYDIIENATAVTFYFGSIAATTDVVCSLNSNDSNSFRPCKPMIIVKPVYMYLGLYPHPHGKSV